VGHILIRGQDQNALDRIEHIRGLLEGGADFDRTADAFSEDPSVSINHGHLGFIARGQFVKEFEDQAFAMNPGQLSGPVKTQFGYHLIKIFSERKQGVLNCDALDETNRQRIYNKLFARQSEKRLEDFISQMKKSADITVFTN
jgi:parvulin-like peptidyl-prolyl isomerase